MARLLALLILVAGSNTASFAAELTPRETEFFEKKIRPVLVKECYSCHSAKAEKVKGGLLVDTRAGIRQGGETGPAIVPGSVEDSLLIEALRHESFEMPPERMLDDKVIADFVTWIEMGAPDPREGKKLVRREIDIEAGRKFWSFQPPRDSPPPQVAGAPAGIDPIDLYLLAAQQKQGLTTATAAEPEALIRRLYFDLIGLPPTPAQIEAFTADPSAKRYAEIIDQLLASPQFGERWGRHWLDVARFAESNGRERNVLYPHAWRYRSYVIDAFNKDKPYDQFVREQLAGDLLPAESDEERTEHLVATGLMAIGPKLLNERNQLAFAMDMIDEQIDITTRTFMGISVSCARCHDHKFDPIPTEDYYALAGIFRSSNTLYGTGGQNGNRQPSKLMPIGKQSNAKADALAEYEKELKAVQRRIANIQKQLVRVNQQLKKNDDNDKLQAKQKEFTAEIKQLQAKQKELRNNAPERPAYAMGMEDGKPQDCRICIRGETDSLGDSVERGLVRVISTGEEIEIPTDASGRLEMANWIADANNPLTARVMVNRIWLHLFGRGIVATPDNFGVNGDPPAHPELLDHLALRFISEGWSVKQMIRTLVTTRSYQLSSAFDAKNYEIDPENVTNWRMSSRRLDAEAIRDSILAVSGGLELEPPKESPVAGNEGILGRNVNLDSIAQDSRNRSVYLPILRNNVPEAVQVFDFAEPSFIVGMRQRTTVPAQALYMMNSPFVLQQSAAFASRLLSGADANATDADRIDDAYRLALGRKATPAEVDRTSAYLVRARDLLDGRDREQAAWTGVCQALIASAEFRYLR